jgi:hypothetical protein
MYVTKHRSAPVARSRAASPAGSCGAYDPLDPPCACARDHGRRVHPRVRLAGRGRRSRPGPGGGDHPSEGGVVRAGRGRCRIAERRQRSTEGGRRSHVERARQRTELARPRYLAVDPDNRLLADTLEADWNDALRALQAAQDEYERASAAARAALGEEQKQRIRTPAADIPALCTNPATPQRERKRMVRLLIEDVTLSKTDAIHAHVRLRGGQTTSLTLPIRRPPASPARPTRTRSPCSTGRSTSTPTPRSPPRSTPPAIAPAKASATPAGSCSASAVTTTFPVTPNGCAPAARPPTARSRHCSISTRPRSSPGTAPACPDRRRPTTRTNGSTTRRRRATRDSSNSSAGRSPTENRSNQHQEVQYETNSLS